MRSPLTGPASAGGVEPRRPVDHNSVQINTPQLSHPAPARLDSRQVTNVTSRSSSGSRSSTASYSESSLQAQLGGPRARSARSPDAAASSQPVKSDKDTAAVRCPAPAPTPKPSGGGFSAFIDYMHASLRVHRDVRTYLPPVLSRFLGYRPPAAKAPFDPMPFPPFSWLRYVPLKYEVWMLSTIGAFVGIALIEIVMATRFAGAPHGTGIVLIVASFGASAVLVYGALDAPLSQPRNLVGGQVICAFTGVWVTKVFRHAAAYEIHDTTEFGDLGHVVWLNGAFAMAFSLLLMLMTDTVHPPAGATALIAAVQPAVVSMGWRYIYIVLISSLLMLGWGLIINNLGRRRYPTYWISGKRVYVRTRDKPGDVAAEEGRGVATTATAAHVLPDHARTVTQNSMMMAALEGQNDGFDAMTRALSRSTSRADERSSGWNEKAA